MGQAGYDEYLLQAIIDINSADSVDFGPAATCAREIDHFWSADPLRLRRSRSRVFVLHRVIGPPLWGSALLPDGPQNSVAVLPRLLSDSRNLSRHFAKL